VVNCTFPSPRICRAGSEGIPRESLACSALLGSHFLQGFTIDVTRNSCYLEVVIVSYRDKRTREFAAGKRVKAFSGFERSARLKLDRMEAATSLRDLAALPGNRLEALVGDRKGQYSIRINDQWRICFEWADRAPEPFKVEIVDYH
jgi:proteic killer suppression protein